MNATKIACMLILITCLVSPTVVASSSPMSVTDFAAIDSYVEAQMKDIGLPGVALGIVEGDQIVHLKGYGIADPTGRAVTPQTPFLVGSLAKPVTALAIMQLVEAGQVDLDAPVRDYLPYFRLADGQDSAAITVRHLLNHTSGLSSATGNEEFPSAAMLDWTPEERVRELSDNSLSHEVGTTYEYSNVNYVLLALIVESVSGQSFERYVQGHIFDPLNMRQSTYYAAGTKSPDSAAGYQQWFGIPVASDVPLPRSGNSSGGLIASAEDMTHFLIAQLNDGRYENVTVIMPAGMAEMHAPAARVADTDSFYAMGWEVETVDGSTILSHSGHHANYVAKMLMAGDGRGIVVMTNANSLLAATRATGIPAGVASLLSGQQPPANDGVPAIRMIYWGIISIVALQLIGMAWSLVMLWRWSRDSHPVRRPRGWLGVVWHIVLPFVLNLMLAILLTMVVPAILPGGLSLRGIIFLYPDLGYAMATSAVVAFIWIIRTVLAFNALRPVKMPIEQPKQPRFVNP